MWRCGSYTDERFSDCFYKNKAIDKCCYHCDRMKICTANSKCNFSCEEDVPYNDEVLR